MQAVPKALFGLTLFGGTISAALWTASLEREDHKSTQLYGRFMAFCYSLCVLTIAVSP
jgi:hypothetical protein